jgi:hypothetical protein
LDEATNLIMEFGLVGQIVGGHTCQGMKCLSRQSNRREWCGGVDLQDYQRVVGAQGNDCRSLADAPFRSSSATNLTFQQPRVLMEGRCTKVSVAVPAEIGIAMTRRVEDLAKEASDQRFRL